MRVIIKNANFQISGIKDISELLNEVQTNFGGVGDNIGIVENLFRALGADGHNAIWGKIKALYMPVLSVPSDGLKAFYDIVGKGTISVPSANYVIEEKRGVGPNTLGQGLATSIAIPVGITNDGASMFGLVTKSSRMSLANSAGILSTLLSMSFKWENSAGNSIADTSSNSIRVANETAFTIPAKYVLTSVENSIRTLLCNGLSASGSLSPVGSKFSFCKGGYCDISIFGICEGLTSEEATIIEAAIDTFVTEFGVLC